MGFFDNFRKRPQPDAAPPAGASSLQLLFSQPLSTDAAHLQSLIRAYDVALKSATVQGVGAPESSGEAGVFLGDVSWGAHVVQIVGFGAPMPAEVVEFCVQPASYGQELKAEIREQKAHSLLFYKGRATNITEQFVALALVAGALSGEHGLAILNEGARTSIPANFARPTDEDEIKPSELWRTLPPLYLFAGFVKYNVEDASGVWMRTHGLEAFGLPNLATHAQSHEQGGEVFEIFGNVTAYMMEQGPVLAAGHTMQIAETRHMKLRELSDDEKMLDDGAPLLVAEFIGADEVNEHIFGSDAAH